MTDPADGGTSLTNHIDKSYKFAVPYNLSITGSFEVSRNLE